MKDLEWPKETRHLCARVQFVFKEFQDLPSSSQDGHGRYRSPSIETSPGGDDALFRAARYGEKFGRSEDPNHTNAVSSLRKLLNEMVKAGSLEKTRGGVYKEYIGDWSGWCNSYEVQDELWHRLKYGMTTFQQAVLDTVSSILDVRFWKEAARNKRRMS